jgi:hypothetical protein
MANERYLVCPRCRTTCPPATEICDCGYNFTESRPAADANDRSGRSKNDQARYTSKYDTPLKFHKFLVYFLLPIGILVSLIYMLREIYVYGLSDVIGMVIIASYAIITVMQIIALTGLLRWKHYGVITFEAGYLISIILGLTMLIIRIFISSENVSRYIYEIALQIIYLALIHIYYKKRRKLFN